MSAEFEARRTAAAAVIADFEREVDAWTCHRSGIQPDMATWAFRLGDHLKSLLAVPGEEKPDRDRQLTQIRIVIDALDWPSASTEDASFALEQIDEVLRRGAR